MALIGALVVWIQYDKGRITAFKVLDLPSLEGVFPILGLILGISVPLSTLPLLVFAPPILDRKSVV